MEKSSMRERYFAAANGYRGFRSYFNEVFNRGEFLRVYVIKGGPGSGKSSMMKKIADRLEALGARIEEIYCSSDPRSLDGVICSVGEKKIAVIDGTSPHECDAKIPGAADEIINLGENWSSEYLRAKREKIVEINAEKQRAYRCAYAYLSIAGEAEEHCMRVTRESVCTSAMKKAVLDFCHDLNCESEKISKTRLISAFGKDGEVWLDTLEVAAQKVLIVGGNKFLARLFLNEMRDYLSALGILAAKFPSPLDERYLDALYIEGVGRAFIAREGVGNSFDVNTLAIPDTRLAHEEIRAAACISEDAKREASRWFGVASELHFRLEEIYSEAMDFYKNDLLLSKILEQIENILEL